MIVVDEEAPPEAEAVPEETVEHHCPACQFELTMLPHESDAMEWLQRALKTMIEKKGKNYARASIVIDFIGKIASHHQAIHLKCHQMEAMMEAAAQRLVEAGKIAAGMGGADNGGGVN